MNVTGATPVPLVVMAAVSTTIAFHPPSAALSPVLDTRSTEAQSQRTSDALTATLPTSLPAGSAARTSAVKGLPTSGKEPVRRTPRENSPGYTNVESRAAKA